MEDIGWGSVKEAVAHYALSRQRIHQLINRGALGECRKVTTPGGNYWLIPYPFQRRVLQAGRPKQREEGRQR